ncbi:hypothetical protein CC77DRAFT_91037 [Alternaria alternata]|uniref:Uncharacterized protein n=1 Tax=Alternaria alternata TaxID=5599 RepID=A0A177DLU9_ALTAL|nr:hypothetical protein CC77DRAFT_91037 [Alternaria alternata]OAG20914.1 hypothetical protein CC77DRAFT_91037 [Alternaria alternata]
MRKSKGWRCYNGKLVSTGKGRWERVWGMGKFGERDGEKLSRSSPAKSGAQYRYEVRVGRVGQADHTSVLFVWQALGAIALGNWSDIIGNSRYFSRAVSATVTPDQGRISWEISRA